jgi:hypothetical protein
MRSEVPVPIPKTANVGRGKTPSATGCAKTIADFERGAREPYPRTLEDVREALEKAGIEFIDENGGGAGVRLRRNQ